MILRRPRYTGQLAALAGAACLVLAGCDTLLPPLVGKSKTTQDQEKAAAVPPATPPSTASFVHEDRLSDLYAGTTILPPTLPMADTDMDTDDTASEPDTATHKPIASVPLTTNAAALGPLAAAAKRVAPLPGVQLVLLVLTPPAADTGTMDTYNSMAKLAVASVMKAFGDEGIAADRVEVSMATSPTASGGEIRLYRR
jgi:hypothetical protein